MFNLPSTYGWKEDPELLKSKAAQTLALTKMREIVRTTSAGLEYSYLTEFIGAEANMTFINNTAMPQIVLQINQREKLSDSTPMLAIQVARGSYDSITTGQQMNGLHWVITDQEVIQAEEFKAQRKALGANRDRLDQRTLTLILVGRIQTGVNRRVSINGL
jgi:hypothetical protein